MEKVNTGELTPMFFGSAMTNFGVQSFLEKFLEMSPMPQPRMLQDGTILSPENEKFSAFVFKIQAAGTGPSIRRPKYPYQILEENKK